MSDEDERQLNTNSTNDNRRRLSDIKIELQGLMRQKKKYDEEKLKQDGDFLQSEINDLRNAIFDINKEINNQTQTKKRLHVQMTNLRSRSRLRYTNLAIALRDKRRYEAELKKENKNEEYRNLARGEIRSIEAALPILKEEDEYKARIKVAEDAQQAATTKRKKLEESLNKNLRKQTETKQLLSEITDKLPQINSDIENLRSERHHLLSPPSSISANGKRSRRRRSLPNQQQLIDSPVTDVQTPVRSLISFEEDCYEHEKHQYEEQLNKINTLINYFHEKLIEHGLNKCSTPSSELTLSLHNSITPYEEQTILSSYMDETNSDNNILLSKTTTDQSSSAIAMKLPRNFASLNLNSTNQIIHSTHNDGNEIEYKKEFSPDIINKYGGQSKKPKQQQQQQQQQLSLTGKKHKKNKKPFVITHTPQMIVLYNNIRSSFDNCDSFPSMPMYEYELLSTIETLEYFKHSIETYLNELSYNYQYHIKILNDNDQQSKSEDDDIRDSALDTFSETSSLIEPIKQIKIPTILQTRSSTSSDDKKTIILPSSSNHSDPKDDYQCSLPNNNDNNNIQIIRQISDEGYRSVQNEKQQRQQVIDVLNNHNSKLLTRSKSYDCIEKVDQWLSNTSPLASSVPMSVTYNHNFQSINSLNDDHLGV